MLEPKKMRVMVAAGGTGGHLFPAFALAEELGKHGVSVDLITDKRAEDYAEGFPGENIYKISSATITKRSPFAILKTLFLLAKGFWESYSLIGKTQTQLVVGFGGYPSLPPLLAAKMRGCKTVIHEANAVMGRANRFLAPSTDGIALSFKDTQLLSKRYNKKSKLTGNPVREDVLRAGQRPYKASKASDPFHLLIFGGSQGAQFFSEFFPSALAKLSIGLKHRIKITQQCRKENIDQVREIYAQAGIRAELSHFFGNLPELMANSHLVIARSGASTVSELAIIGRPSILVPLPHALDNDQLYNARSLQYAGAALCFEQKKLDEDEFVKQISELIQDDSALTQAADDARERGRPDAVQNLAEFVINKLPKPSNSG